MTTNVADNKPSMAGREGVATQVVVEMKNYIMWRSRATSNAWEVFSTMVGLSKVT